MPQSPQIIIYKSKDGKRKKWIFTSIDMIISVGYRVNSLHGTQFRIWATQKLKEYDKFKEIQKEIEKTESIKELEEDLKKLKS